MRVSDFDYDLPQELIAQTPAEKRDGSSMLTLNRVSGSYELHSFRDIVKYIQPGDCLVLNETRVIPARLWGHRPTGGRVEAFMLEATKDGCWKAFLRPGRRLPVGSRVELDQAQCGGFSVVGKDSEGSSNLASLADFTGIRGNFTRITKDYLHGCYGGIPNIKNLNVEG